VGVVLLVRHGQASWGAEDYDVLSPLGARQAAVLGASLAARGVAPAVVVHGGMQRQRETARLVAEAAGWSGAPVVDAGWDELDHLQVLDRAPRSFAGERPDRAEFQAWFEDATDRWTAGAHDPEYDESYPAFGERVARALAEVTQGQAGDGIAVVVTSGGPIASTVTALLGGGADTYRRLAPVVVNASVSKLVTGRRGTTLVSFNDHAHLESPGSDLLTYR
jgi:broad specificity phosphatase PhoE